MAAATEEHLIDLERKYWDAMVSKDVDTAVRMSDEPVYLAGAQGISQITNDKYRQLMTDGKWTLHSYTMDKILARLTAGQPGMSRPVFLFSGQTAITNQAATRYLARNHERLARKYGNNSFVLLLKVVNSQAYGPDVAELVSDVTRAAQAPLPTPAAPRNSHRAS